MKYIAYVAAVLLFLTSCEFKDVDLVGVDNHKVEKFAGKELLINLGLRIKNDNGFKLKVKPSMLDLLVEDEAIGKVYLDEKLVIRKKTETVYPTKFRVKFNDGYMMKLMKFASKKELAVKFKGNVKAGALGISKMFPVNEQRKISRDMIKQLMMK